MADVSDRIYEFKMTGITELIMHADDCDASLALSEVRKGMDKKNLSTKGDDRSPPWSWYTYLYHDGRNITMPSDNVHACLRLAGKQVTLSKNTKCERAVAVGVRVTGLKSSEHCDLLIDGKHVTMASMDDVKKLDTFEEQAKAVRAYGMNLFAKRARVNTSKHVRVRPRFAAGWTVQGRLVVNSGNLTPAKLAEVVEATEQVGIGDWRPSSKTPGKFGQFQMCIKAAK